jgi:hypothetical protein
MSATHHGRDSIQVFGALRCTALLVADRSQRRKIMGVTLDVVGTAAVVTVDEPRTGDALTISQELECRAASFSPRSDHTVASSWRVRAFRHACRMPLQGAVVLDSAGAEVVVVGAAAGARRSGRRRLGP